jgi:hypothetical protein
VSKYTGTKTDDWKKYEDGIKFNNRLKPNYYDAVNTSIDFFNDKQWRNLESEDFPAPVFNYIKRVITYFVAFMTSSKVKLKLEPLAYAEDDDNPDTEASKIASAEIDNLFEKFKMENRYRDACFDGAIMGDACAHMWWDSTAKPYGGAFKVLDPMYEQLEGEICFELVDGTNVFLGNANNPRIDTKTQPYVGISGRDMVANLKAEAELYKDNQKENITSDQNYNYEAGDSAKIELEADDNGKATYFLLYKYNPETKTIFVSKCTEGAYIYRDIDTELSYYPVAWANWEKQKNCYHGRGTCFGIIPTQIFINRMFAKIMFHLDKTAFPKVIYNADAIETWDDGVGEAIGLQNMEPGESVNNVAAYMQPSQMSAQIVQVIQLAIQYLKETLGINDSMLGNVNPEQASGRSIAITVKQSSIPLDNPQSNMYEWIEDIGRILIDMMGTNYKERPIVITRDGQKVVETFDFSVFKNMWLNVKCDVGPSTYWSEEALVEMLDNLLSMHDPLFDMITYLESLPEAYKNEDLIDKLKQKMEQSAEMQEFKQAKYEKMAQFMETLPPEIQKQLQSMPSEKMEKQVQQMMQQRGNSNTLPQ